MWEKRIELELEKQRQDFTRYRNDKTKNYRMLPHTKLIKRLWMGICAPQGSNTGTVADGITNIRLTLVTSSV